MINASLRLEDLRVPRGNELEALRGDRKGQHSIRINDQYRVCFIWSVAGAERVEITNCHYRRRAERRAAARAAQSLDYPLDLLDEGLGETHMVRIPTHGPPVHPGEMLLEEFLVPHGISQHKLAEMIGVTVNRVNEIVKGKRGVSPGTAIRLKALFGASAQFWLNLQLAWDLYHAQHAPDVAEVRKQIKRLAAAGRGDKVKRAPEPTDPRVIQRLR